MHSTSYYFWLGIPQSPLSYQATPTNNVHLASPPLGESRAGTISDTIRYNHEGEGSPPIVRPQFPRGTPPVVVEVSPFFCS